ncbi:unnamed protein product, partial [Chrysoparadoxa australica]
PTHPSTKAAICPYSNTVKGCPRPLVDKHGKFLEHEMAHNDQLTDYTKLKKWMDEATAQQRCTFGLHQPITAIQARPFKTFWARPECGGFSPFEPKGLHRLVKSVLTKEFLLMLEMQAIFKKEGPRGSVERPQLALQRERVMGLESYYTELTGEGFTREAPCERNIPLCNAKRLAEGKNHSHPVVVEKAELDLSDYDTLLLLRAECVRLRLSQATGPVSSIEHRERVFNHRIAE